jgi:hypothetical protein
MGRGDEGAEVLPTGTQLLELLPELLRLALSDPEGPDSAAGLPALRLRDAATWEATLVEARAHRVDPLLGYMLRRRGLDLQVPSRARTALMDAYRQTLMANTVLLQNLGRLLSLLDEAGVRPILFKGILLADVYYPDLGTRAMGDVDLLIQPAEFPPVARAFAAMGFAQEGVWGSSGAVYFRNSLGVSFDVHHQFRLFPPELRASIVEEVEMPGLVGRRVLGWEPNARLVHLLVHLAEHRPKSGFLLGWLLDLAFVVQRDGLRLAPDRIVELMPNRQRALLLWRALGLLRSECGLVLPAALSAAADAVEPLRLTGILRDRRLAQWGLPGLRGWLRLFACRLGLRRLPEGGYPWVSDLALGLLPACRE